MSWLSDIEKQLEAGGPSYAICNDLIDRCRKLEAFFDAAKTLVSEYARPKGLYDWTEGEKRMFQVIDWKNSYYEALKALGDE